MASRWVFSWLLLWPWGLRVKAAWHTGTGGVGNQTGSEGRERAAVRLNDITLFCPVAGSKAARLISAQGITDSYMYWGDCNRFRPLTRSPMEALI